MMRHHHHHHQSSCHQRSGFTLLELILAVGLTSLLMAAVYGAMSTYWNLAMESHEVIERSQIARSLLQQLARDIQACTFAEQETQLDDDSANSDDRMTTEADTEMNAAGIGVRRNGLVGTDRDLVLCISYPANPARDPAYVPSPDAVGTSDRSSDLMVVRWLLAEATGDRLASALAELHATEGDNAVAGLARGHGGVTGFGQAVENNNFDLQVESTTLLAAEVQSILFEYFDGVDWLTEWDSSLLNKMPQAVRIELTLRKSPSAGDGRVDNPRDLPSTTHSLVVPVPVASPYIEETAI
ncbi:MAG: prepilin-type N-terminal cleavage/methylation domain-containing protein [Planctomycetaceae bacterium]